MLLELIAESLKAFNEDELFPLVAWCKERDMDLTFIEVMPMGDIGNENRIGQYWCLKDVRADYERVYPAPTDWTFWYDKYRAWRPADYVPEP